MKSFVAVISFFLLANSTMSFAWGVFDSPSSFDECILEAMKGTTSDVAARSIHRSCRNKFPVAEPTYFEIPHKARQQLSSRGWFSNGIAGSQFFVKIHNGSEWSLKEVEVSIKDNESGDVKTYSHSWSYLISPKEAVNFSFSVIEEPEDVSFWISNATGAQ